jgi:hypothetical protein
MGTKSRESIYGASVRASAERAAEARKQDDRLACDAWNKRMLAFQGPAQPSPTIGDALNAGYLYLEVKCLGCQTHQTVALDIVRRRKTTLIHELERYMHCRHCSELQAYPFTRVEHDAVGNAAGPRTGGPRVTNIRNTSSPHWRGWLKPEQRCLVPANSFAEYASEPNPETKKKDVVWLALNDDRPLFAFADIWTTFNGDRGTKSKPMPGPHQVYGFSDDGTERCRRADPFQGYTGDPRHRRGTGRLDARTGGRGQGIAAAAAG